MKSANEVHQGEPQEQNSRNQYVGSITGTKVENKIGIDDAILLSNQLSKLVNQEYMSDVTFIVGNEQTNIYAHRVILAARSKVFEAMLFGGLRETQEREIAVPNVRPAVFICMMEYVYGGKTVITSDTAVELLAASSQYDIENLVEKCGRHIRETLSVSNVCNVLVETQGFPEIYEMCVEFVEANAATVFRSQAFLELPESIVIDLVRRDYLCIQEVELFKAIIEWGKHCCHGYELQAARFELSDSEYGDVACTDHVKKLRICVRNIIPHVRLPLISARDLLQEVKPTQVVPTKLYLKAMEYLAAPNQVDTGNNRFFRRRLGFGPLFAFCWLSTTGFKIADSSSLTAMRVGTDEWKGIFGNRRIHISGSKQIVRFEIKINRINADRSGMVIGLARLRDRYNCCWGYGGSGYSYPSQTVVVKDSEFQKDDVIGVHLDVSKRQVSFYRNGSLVYVNARIMPLGIEVYPVVYMHYVYDEVAIRS